MQLIFNELSFLPLIEDEYRLENQFVNMLKLFEQVKQKFGIFNLIFPKNVGSIKVLTDLSFYQWIDQIPSGKHKNTILAVIKQPFGEELITNREQELPRYYYQNEDLEIEEYCRGLAVAYLKNKVTISLALHSHWRQDMIPFYRIIDENFNTESLEVANIAETEMLEHENLNRALLYSSKLELLQTSLLPSQKQVDLRDDHGKDRLKAFSNRLIQSVYVVKIINSLPFNPTARNLIRRCYEDGRVELVLYWEDSGIGLLVQTTGRNIRETEEIARILKNKFDR